MQQQKVVSWLSQHNFPHGLVSFADGLSTDPLGHKAAYLKNLIEVRIHTEHSMSKAKQKGTLCNGHIEFKKSHIYSELADTKINVSVPGAWCDCACCLR